MFENLKFAYLMHVDWDWIKQRPHFLYEELTKIYEVELYFIHKVIDSKAHYVRNTKAGNGARKIKKIPFSGRFPILRLIERLLNRRLIKSVTLYDVVWITSPLLLDFIPAEIIKRKIVVYDCMDDFLGFYSGLTGSKKFERLWALENDLLKIADIVFFSSEYLRDKQLSTYKDISGRLFVVNNGISSELINKTYPAKLNGVKSINSKRLNLMYFGTIDRWLDFELILNTLQEFPDISFTLIGPINVRVPSHSRIKYVGPIPHEKLYDFSEEADAFIMPFNISQLIRSVDPVKIYEYLFFDKPVFVIDYEEIYKFLPFVHMYSNQLDFFKLIKDLQEGRLKSLNFKDKIEFLNKNTWSERCKQIVTIIEEVRV